MPQTYQPPGVSVREIVGNSITTVLEVPALVCLIGLSQGFQTRTDQITLTGTTAIPLPGLPVGATLTTVTAVKDTLNPSKGAVDGSGYVVTTDYTVQAGAGTVTRVGAGGISSGTLVNVTYQYVVASYFSPILLADQGSVESRFGPALNAAGTAINSPLSYAAQIAFENGVGQIVLQPLFVRATPGDSTTAASQPNATQNATVSTWTDSLSPLRDITNVNIIVPIVGQSQTSVTDSIQLGVFQAVQDHEQFMLTQNQYCIGIFGEDQSTSTSVATEATIQGHATTLQGRYGGILAQQNVLLNAAAFTRSLPSSSATGLNITVGGQYAAAAVAGMIASRPVSASLTRKVLSGFIAATDARTLQQKNQDAGAGLMVIEQKGANVVVRHSITLDQTSSATRELSVVRAKHFMIESLIDTIDSQIIGNVIADGNSAAVVSATVVAVLEQLRANSIIVDYTGVQSRMLSLDPTTVQCRFSYRPAFPLNYVDIQFSLDLTTGALSTTDTTAGTLTGV